MSVEDWTIEDPEHTLVLIGCSAKKLDRPAQARDLYTGNLFRLSVAWAQSWGLEWMVLSALHGIVEPDRVLAPYNFRLGPAEHDRRRLAQMIGPPLHTRGAPAALVVLAGADYVECVRRSTVGQLRTWTPLQDLPARGLGYYRGWLTANTCRSAAS